ncbi:MAG: MarR family transcriptional regulator [Clostridia bacterium]|nr:MarR family transcriptional regulator [Clostridia bacterium]
MIDLRDNVGRYVSMTYRHTISYMARKMEALQIGAGQYPYLFTLYLEDGQSQQSLTDRMLVDKAATVRSINKLEEAGYVERRPDCIDKRSYRIFLTEKGRTVRPQLEAIVQEVQEILLDNMSTEEKIILKRLMQQIARNIVKAVR